MKAHRISDGGVNFVGGITKLGSSEALPALCR
jgi:hypothetical protein